MTHKRLKVTRPQLASIIMTKGFTLRRNFGAPPEALCGFVRDSASKIVAWSVPCNKICAIRYLLT